MASPSVARRAQTQAGRSSGRDLLAGTTLVVPALSTNGSSEDNLIEQQRAINDAAIALSQALAAASPNGRDYLRDDLQVAIKRHVLKMEMVRAIIADVEETYEKIQEQVDERDAFRAMKARR